MQPITIAFLAALVAVATASNGGCPHPNEAKNLIFEKKVEASANNEGRHVEHIELGREVIGRSDISCITVVANTHGHTPDMLSFGRNKVGGYSVVLHSRIRNPMNATLYVYTS